MASSTVHKVAAVVGVGPGLGRSIARRFAKEGFAVGLMARRGNELDPIKKEIEKEGGKATAISVDATDQASVKKGFETLRKEFGHPTVVVYNAGAYVGGGILDLKPEAFENAWKANCFGGLLVLQEVLPYLAEQKTGTIIFTGATASVKANPKFSGLSVGKFGLRALASAAAREYLNKGVHIAHVVIDGVIAEERTRKMLPHFKEERFVQPDSIAETYWHIHTQHPSAWSHEIDLRSKESEWI